MLYKVYGLGLSEIVAVGIEISTLGAMVEAILKR
jgi:hypothetical protein